MQDLFQNRKLKNILPQFYKKDGLKNVYSFRWVEEKIASYLKSVFKAKVVDDKLIVQGKKREKIEAIKQFKGILEDMFNNIPSLTKNIRKDTRLLLPIDNLESLKQAKTVGDKLQIMEYVLDNIKYNPDFQTKQKVTPLYVKEQRQWLKKVGIL